MHPTKKMILFLTPLIIMIACTSKIEESSEVPPNFLFCIADDWSFPHAGVYGDSVVKTPNFDRVAKEGILFMNAFTAASSCSPSRAAILTGQDIYRLEAGGCLFGTLPQKFPIYTHLLAQSGYKTGFTGKGYAPTKLDIEGWTENPAGPAYNEINAEVPVGIRPTNYAANFEQFLNEKTNEQPFCFWYGASEPHRRYEYGIGAKNGYDLSKIKVPGFLPDTEETRNDVADYYYEVEWFDTHLGSMINLLKEKGLLENTIIVVTSDNGMPFPRAKSNAYNYGEQMPLAIRWGARVQPEQIIHTPVSLIDIAPTFLELAQLPIPEQMTGKSLVPILFSKSASIPDRPYVVTALERHTIARPNNRGYPIRTIHTEDFTYIYNFEPDRWPGGNPDIDAWPQGFYGDIDDGAAKTLFEENPEKWPELFSAAFGKRPQEELFAVKTDFLNWHNLANDSTYLEQKKALKKQLFDYLKKTKDPRMEGLSPWDNYLYTGQTEWEY